MLEVLKCLFLPVFAFQILAAGALAADKLQADCMPLGLRTRNNAPIPIEMRFKWDSTRILEGRLELELHEGNRILGRYRSGDLALTTGEQRYRMLLPPFPSPYSDSQVEVRMRFIAAGEIFDLDPSTLFMPTVSERSFVLGWYGARNGTALQPSGLERSFLFERFAPQAHNPARSSLMTSIVRLTSDDLPAQPLSYTAFDVVVLSADGFKEAREGQLRSLARWVKGGGSVCVFVTGSLQPRHLWFLNELAASSSGAPAFLSDNDGHLIPGSRGISCVNSEMGRSVIVAGKAAADPPLDSSDWRQAVAFLWKFRGSRMRAIAETGHWEIAAASVRPDDSYAQQFQQGRFRTRLPLFGRARPAAPASYPLQSTEPGAELMGRLMPSTVRLIPFSALMGILGLFLLVIGPADYFVLGWLRRRRYTWVLFPATSIGFMFATMLMANHYLGLRDQRRSLVIVDVGSDGTALRWNRYELIFAARDKQAVTELKGAMWAPLAAAGPDFAAAPMPGGIYTRPARFYRSGNPYARGTSERETGPPLYEGALPAHFQTSESLRQWQPELNRIFSFDPPPAPLPANWRDVEKAWPDLKAVRAKLSATRPFEGDLWAVSSINPPTFDSGSRGILSSSLLEELTIGNPRGPLSLVSQLSPTGGGNFEDEQSVDIEARDAALAIVTQAGDDIIVYRRFFHGN